MTDPRADLETQADQAAAAGDAATAARLLAQAAEGSDQPGVWIKLSAMRRASGDHAGALRAIDAALALAPLDLSALLARAFLLERAGDPHAPEAFLRAAAQAPVEGDPPPHLAKALDHAARMAGVYKQTTFERLENSLPPGIDTASKKRLDRFISNSAHLTRHFHQEPSHFHFPGMPEIEFHEPAQFDSLAELEQATDTIRAEFEAVMAAEAAELVPYIQYPDRVPLRQWKELNRNSDWTAIHLLRNGERVEANARHCPATLGLLTRLPQPHVAGASPNAMFSLLAPHTHIPPHTGVANTRLVCHLPLIVPDDCGFRVGATTRQWNVGEAFVFDDTIEHEAWNDSGELRVVLIVDLWAPALSDDDRAGVAKVISALGVGFGGGI